MLSAAFLIPLPSVLLSFLLFIVFFVYCLFVSLFILSIIVFPFIYCLFDSLFIPFLLPLLQCGPKGADGEGHTPDGHYGRDLARPYSLAGASVPVHVPQVRLGSWCVCVCVIIFAILHYFLCNTGFY